MRSLRIGFCPISVTFSYVNSTIRLYYTSHRSHTCHLSATFAITPALPQLCLKKEIPRQAAQVQVAYIRDNQRELMTRASPKAQCLFDYSLQNDSAQREFINLFRICIIVVTLFLSFKKDNCALYGFLRYEWCFSFLTAGGNFPNLISYFSFNPSKCTSSKVVN